MKELIFENDLYYFDKGKLYDENFIECPTNISDKVLADYYNSIDYKSLNENDLYEYLKLLKASGFYAACLKVIDFSLKKFDNYNFYRKIFAIKLSCHRGLNEPQKAIDFWTENQIIFSSCASVPLFTSLAAAYCDIKDYANAIKYAKRAYALQGGGLNYTSELSLVFQRIKKESGYDFT